MNKRGKVATTIVTGLFLLAVLGLIITSGPSITGASVGSKSVLGSAILVIFALALVSLVPQALVKEQKVEVQSEASFSTLNDRLKQIDDELNKLF